MQKVYEFNERNNIGKNGEYLLAELFPNIFTLTDGMEGDLLFKNEHKFELKTDTYKSGNFFFEKISNVRLNNKGGVWQTKEHGCNYYSFYMLRYDKLFVFKVDEILEWLDKNVDNYHVKTVKNPTKESKGYAIPITDVSHVCVKIIDLNESNNYKKLKNKYFNEFCS
jgi:hypothetical protein